MNEMYNMGLSLHSVGSVAILAVIILNLFLLISYKELLKYRKLLSVFITPLTYTTLGYVIFSGTIMMAAKQLEFTLENIVMILIAIVYIALEVKRLKSLKYLNSEKERAFDAYKPIARTILQVQFILVLLVSIWMWVR